MVHLSIIFCKGFVVPEAGSSPARKQGKDVDEFFCGVFRNKQIDVEGMAAAKRLSITCKLYHKNENNLYHNLAQYLLPGAAYVYNRLQKRLLQFGMTCDLLNETLEMWHGHVVPDDVSEADGVGGGDDPDDDKDGGVDAVKEDNADAEYDDGVDQHDEQENLDHSNHGDGGDDGDDQHDEEENLDHGDDVEVVYPPSIALMHVFAVRRFNVKKDMAWALGRMEMYAPFGYLVDYIMMYIKTLLRSEDLFWRHELVMKRTLVGYEVPFNIRNLFLDMQELQVSSRVLEAMAFPRTLYRKQRIHHSFVHLHNDWISMANLMVSFEASLREGGFDYNMFPLLGHAGGDGGFSVKDTNQIEPLLVPRVYATMQNMVHSDAGDEILKENVRMYFSVAGAVGREMMRV